MTSRARIALALAAFCVVLLALPLVERRDSPPLSESVAVAAALENESVSEFVERFGHDRARVVGLDHELTRVTLFRGPRIVANVAVRPNGEIAGIRLFRPRGPVYGSRLSEGLPLVALFTGVAALMLLTTPLLTFRNLDVLALLALAIPIVAGYNRLFDLSVYALYPPLAWLAGRCAWRALGPGSGPGESLSLYERSTRSWGPRRQLRMLAIIAGAAALALTAIAVTSPGAIDVGFASVQGATALLHGGLPYGSLTDVLHGDTYPLLNYALYIPGALLLPVRDAFDDSTGALVVAAAAALATAAALKRAATAAAGPVAGWRLAIAWLCFPPVVAGAAAGSNDLPLAALVALALAAVATRPAVAGCALAVGAWVKVAPLAVLPALLAGLRGDDRRRALGAVALTSGIGVVWLVALGGVGAIGDMADGIAFQFRRGTLQSAWVLAGADGIQRGLQGALAALIVLLALRAREDPSLARDPGWLAAATGAILAGLQLTANNATVIYATWAFPAVALALLIPQLSANPLRAPTADRTRRARAPSRAPRPAAPGARVGLPLP